MDSTEKLTEQPAATVTADTDEESLFGGTELIRLISEQLYLDARRYDGRLTGGEG